MENTLFTKTVYIYFTVYIYIYPHIYFRGRYARKTVDRINLKYVLYLNFDRIAFSNRKIDI